MQFIFQIVMSLIGTKVWTYLIKPILFIIVYLFRLFTQSSKPIQPPQAQVQRLDDNTCCICLQSPKRLKMAPTCGHSFCGGCILDSAKKDKKCPLCRQEIVNLFAIIKKQQKLTPALQKELNQFNKKCSDTRSFGRSISQIIFVAERVGQMQLISRIDNSKVLKWLIGWTVYFLSPIDLIPDVIIGIGWIDDLLVGVVSALLISNSNHINNQEDD